MLDEHDVAVTCPTCGAANLKAPAWVRTGGPDFECEGCRALIHVDSVDWLQDFRASVMPGGPDITGAR